MRDSMQTIHKSCPVCQRAVHAQNIMQHGADARFITRSVPVTNLLSMHDTLRSTGMSDPEHEISHCSPTRRPCAKNYAARCHARSRTLQAQTLCRGKTNRASVAASEWTRSRCCKVSLAAMAARPPHKQTNSSSTTHHKGDLSAHQPRHVVAQRLPAWWMATGRLTAFPQHRPGLPARIAVALLSGRGSACTKPRWISVGICAMEAPAAYR